MTITVYLPNEESTQQWAEQLADCLKGTPPKGGIFYLQGDLGAGKTTFVRAFLRRLGVQGRIKSPSYALAEHYELSQQNAYHLDFYRFSDPREWLDAGFRELFHEPQAIVLVEWPEQAQDLLPEPDLRLQLHYQPPGRLLELQPLSEQAHDWLQQLKLIS